MHPRSLISAFVIRLLESIIFILATSEILICYLFSGAEETGIKLALSETPKVFLRQGPYNSSVCVRSHPSYFFDFDFLCSCWSCNGARPKTKGKVLVIYSTNSLKMGPKLKFYLLPLTRPTLKKGPTQNFRQEYFFFNFITTQRLLRQMDAKCRSKVLQNAPPFVLTTFAYIFEWLF